MKPTKDAVANQFDRMSHAYAKSAGHASGDDLPMLVEFVEPRSDMRVLDVATGAGHTAAAIAPHVREVTAIDIAPSMLDRTRELAAVRGLTNLRVALMDVEALDFPAGSFDAVTCRIAPHHFIDIDTALREIARVLAAGGTFVVEDSIVPDDPLLDAYFNDLERIRDATHVRSLTLAQWRSKLEDAGLRIERSTIHRKRHDAADWIERAGLSEEGVRRVYAALGKAPAAAVEHFAIAYGENGRATEFTDEKAIVRARKEASARA
jgi:ubiquinone/menaquinone biosynthesis C-methylase UbiE